MSRISARDQRERRSHRYTGDKLASLVNEIQAGGDKIFARSRDARKEEEVTAFLGDADKDAPLEVCISYRHNTIIDLGHDASITLTSECAGSVPFRTDRYDRDTVDPDQERHGGLAGPRGPFDRMPERCDLLLRCYPGAKH